MSFAKGRRLLPKVTVRNNNLEAALRVFKRKVNDSGILLDYREHEYFEKKSTTKCHAKASAKVRERKRQEKNK